MLLFVVACAVGCSGATGVDFQDVNFGPHRMILQGPSTGGFGNDGIRNQLAINAATRAVQGAAIANSPASIRLATRASSNSAQTAAYLDTTQFIDAQTTSYGRKLLAMNATNTTALLKENNATLFETLLKGAGLWSVATNPNLVATFLVPTDQAVKRYAAKLGLAPAQLSEYPALLKAITRYHIVLGAKLTNGKQLKVGRTNGITADPRWNVTIIKAANGSVTVRDVQGNIARVTKADIDDGNIVIHTVDSVLRSGDVFISAYDALTFYNVLSTLKGLVDKAGLKNMTMNPQMNATIFAPINSSFKGAPTLDNATLTNVLKYHILPGARTIPSDFVSAKSVQTLYKGHTLSVKYELVVKKLTGIYSSFRALGYAYVVPEAGSKSKRVLVIKPNIFAGLSIIHGINGLLLPNMNATKMAKEG